MDWFHKITRYHATSTGQIYGQAIPSGADTVIPDPSTLFPVGSPFASDYVESWRYMLETGTTFGPFGMRLFFSWTPGPDRRHGILIDRQPSIRYPSSTPVVQAAWRYSVQENDGQDQSATGLHNPYSIFLGYLFGGGTQSQQYIDDATVFAAGMDYAMAANLTVNATVITARRNSHGYGWGFIRPAITAPVIDSGNFGNVDYKIRGTYAEPSPAMPHADLGWEITAGFTWELLDGWVVDGRIAYWRPGRWFKYACIDKSVANWDAQTAANNWGINPNRDIDPMLGFEIRFGGSY